MSLLSIFVYLSVLSYNGVLAIKSFRTIYGDIYDCVDFYMQPAFNHPNLMNHSLHPLMRPSYQSKIAKINTPKRKTKREGCPIGTVPIRRITKGASKRRSFAANKEVTGRYVAGVGTKESGYAGGGMVVSIYNPPDVEVTAWSKARILISHGPDSIQVGWRVDPSARGDNLTRMFLYTDASDVHCMDADCGFVIVDSEFRPDTVLHPVSQVGGDTYEYQFNITRDPKTKHWWLHVGSEGSAVGLWPKDVFTSLKEDLATSVDWAGEVFCPPGVPEPAMGSGYPPDVDDYKSVAYFKRLTVVTSDFTSVEASDLEEFRTDKSLYDAKFKGYGGPNWGYYAYFGGAKH